MKSTITAPCIFLKDNFMQQLNRPSFFVFLFFFLSLILSCTDNKIPAKKPLIEKIITEVSSARIESTISNLVAFETRYPHEKQIEVAGYLHNELGKHVKNTVFHEYEFWGVTWKNVVGSIPGKRYPEQTVIVCAHLDSKSEKRLVFAPGADDNASGCAGVLEIARILAGHSFEKTIKFIFFSRESTGQQGSKAYVKDINRETERIFAVINMDMIAYGNDAEDIDLVTRPNYSWLAESIFDLSLTYNINAKTIIKKSCY